MADRAPPLPLRPTRNVGGLLFITLVHSTLFLFCSSSSIPDCRLSSTGAFANSPIWYSFSLYYIYCGCFCYCCCRSKFITMFMFLIDLEISFGMISQLNCSGFTTMFVVRELAAIVSAYHEHLYICLAIV